MRLILYICQPTFLSVSALTLLVRLCSLKIVPEMTCDVSPDGTLNLLVHSLYWLQSP